MTQTMKTSLGFACAAALMIMGCEENSGVNNDREIEALMETTNLLRVQIEGQQVNIEHLQESWRLGVEGDRATLNYVKAIDKNLTATNKTVTHNADAANKTIELVNHNAGVANRNADVIQRNAEKDQWGS